MNRASPQAKRSGRALALQRFSQARKEMAKALRTGGLGTLHDESRVSLDELARINTLGMLTEDSQQGNIEYGPIPSDRALYTRVWKDYVEEALSTNVDVNPKEQRRRYKAAGGKYGPRGVDSKERAYVVGYVSLEKAHALSQLLNQQDNIVAWFSTAQSSPAERKQCTGAIQDAETRVYVTYELAHQEGHYSPHDAYPLYGVTSLPSGLHPISSPYNFAIDTALTPSMDRYFAYFTVLDARYGHSVTKPDGLFKRVIEALELVQ